MALFTCNFFSKILSTTTRVMVFLPSPTSSESLNMSLDQLYAPGAPYPVLYLLHGMYGDETAWMRRTKIELYAQENGFAVVMPYGENGFYTDMAHGQRWFTYLTEELPRFMRRNFRISERRQDTFIAGLSMGGYGACKAALANPDRYAAFASLSGAVDIEALARSAAEQGVAREAEDILGDLSCVKNSSADLLSLAETLKQSGQTPPPAYIACGVDDTLCYPMNLHLKAGLEALEYPMIFVQGPGKHEWRFWDQQIERAVLWFAELRENDSED